MEPKIVLCSQNHVYDAAIDTECPYCRKIAEGQKKLDQMIHHDQNGQNARQQEENTGHTELLDRRGIPYEEDDGDTDTTELIIPAEKSRKASDAGKVIGWLVCVAGTRRGRSFQVLEGVNYLCAHSDAVVSGRSPGNPYELAALLSRQEKTGEYILSPCSQTGFLVNEFPVVKPQVLQSYSSVQWDSEEYIFVSFVGKQFEWR